MEEMTLDFNKMTEAISLWGTDPDRLSTNFYSLDISRLDGIRTAIFDVATQLWLQFKDRNMFDFNNIDNLSFPFVMTDILGTNLVLMKDNVISSNEVKIYGKFGN